MVNTSSASKVAGAGPGTLQPEELRGRRAEGSQYAILLTRVRAAGLLNRRPSRYLPGIVANALLLAFGWITLFAVRSLWSQLAIAIYIAVLTTRSALYAHDAGHSQISKSRKVNYLIGIATANLTVGISFGWWTPRHRQHHVHPNHEGRDPDLFNPLIAFTPSQARNPRPIQRFPVKHQAGLLFFLITLLPVAMQINSILGVLRMAGRRRVIEASSLAIHHLAYFAIVFMALSPWHAIIFMAVQQGALGFYLGCIFAPNHKGMRVWQDEDQMDFVERQVLSSRNVHGPALIDYLYGGLNYQIEHHLFPSMPRQNLRHARPIIFDFCQEYNITYLEASFLDSFKAVIRYMRALSKMSTQDLPR